MVQYGDVQVLRSESLQTSRAGALADARRLLSQTPEVP